MNLVIVTQHSAELVGRNLNTYSPRGRHRKAAFTIEDISPKGIKIRPEKSGRSRISRTVEVDKMGDAWDQYKRGEVTRDELANGSPAIFNTSYLSSIFHCIETELCG